MGLRKFPKRYSTFARQTEGMVGGRTRASVPVVSPAPSAGLELAKAKLKIAALALALSRARQPEANLYDLPIQNTFITPVIPDYNLEREPGDPWAIPDSWAARLPRNHFDFLREVTNYQRTVDGIDPVRGFGPLRIGEKHGIHEVRQVRELLELSSVHLARTTLLPFRRTPGADFAPFLQRLEVLYRRQYSLADLKTTTTLLNQQYSTPSPLAGILGEWVARSAVFSTFLSAAYEGALQAPQKPLVLEPTAGNGLLTVRFDPRIVTVNELEDTRLSHLLAQPFNSVSPYDAADLRQAERIGQVRQLFPAVITNPPFGSTDTQLVRHRYGTEDYRLNGWEHVIAAHAVNRLDDNGRAAIIIGGHHQYNANGKLVGRDWIFFNYLYAHFNVAHVLHLDSHKLYARQGATWPIRVILLDGVKREPGGYAPTGKAGAPLPILTTFREVAQAISLID